MLQIAVCDDDIKELSNVGTLINEYRTTFRSDITYMSFTNPIELCMSISSDSQIDLIFLDIVMPDQNGIETARKIRKHDENVKIIFLTSSAEFAVDSYAVGAYYYALKPIVKESFFALLQKVTAEINKQDEHLIVKCKTGISRIRLRNLCFCEVISKTVYYHLSDGAVLESSGSITELENQLLLRRNFVKPHRSYIVNMLYIETLTAKEIIMVSKEIIPLPKPKYNEVKNAYLSIAFSNGDE